jgi:aryl-alcohol dehydrogenase-like predicted oxidoreductase
LDLVDKVVQLAKTKGCTPGQLALAWLLKQGDNVIPIPGTRQLKYLEENLGSLKVELSDREVKEIREVAEKADVIGESYMASMVPYLFADTI